MKKEKILQWLNELADKNLDSYQEYFYYDVRNRDFLKSKISV